MRSELSNNKKMTDEYHYYETLGLNRDASRSEISKAYRSLAKTYHPDVSSHPNAKENFLRIHEAYEALSDAKRKREYDTYLDTLEEDKPNSENDDTHIEHEFYVQNETLTIDGKNYTINNAYHMIINGEEFVEYNGETFTYEREDFPFDIHDIEYEFYVTDETITIDEDDYIFNNAHHIVVNGQEYIESEEGYLPFNNQDAQEDYRDSYQSGGGIGKILVNVLIILVIAFTVFHGISIMKSSPDAGAFLENIAPAIPTENHISHEEQFAQKIKEAMDSENTTTRNYALSLIDKSHGGERNIAQICDIWENVYKDWTYISDPKGFEYFSHASNTIKIDLKGDCDDFAILIASLVESTGGSSRVILAQGANGGGHAYAEVYVTDNKKDFDKIAKYITNRYKCRSVAYHIKYDDDKNPRYWLNLDWQSKHPGGKFYNSKGILTVYYPNGYWDKMRSNT